MAERSSDAQLRDRELAALELLAAGSGSALTAQTLSERFSVSLRQARRYVAAASFELVEDATPAELDRQQMLSLHRLDLLAGRAMASGDEALAIKATRAHSIALAQFRRAISIPATRFRLRDKRLKAPDEPPSDCPF
jgi:hypothetical protein